MTEWLAAERDRLILFAPVLLGAGVALYFDLLREPARWPVAAALATVAAAGVLGRRVVAIRIAACAAAAVLFGLAAAEWRTARMAPLPALPRGATTVTGRVAAIAVLPEGGRRLLLAAPSLDGEAPLGRMLRVRLRDTDPVAVADGDTVRVRALVRPPMPPAFPGDRDGRRDAFFGGLAGAGFAIGPATVVGPADGRGGIAEWWRGVRDRVALRLERDLPGPRGAIAATLLVGLGDAIPPDDRQAFADSGLAHLLAVAGLHIGIVMGLALALARRGFALSEHASLRWPAKELSVVAALAAGGLYLLATGAHVPIVRSFCMATLATIAVVLGRRAVSMRGLALAAVAILLAWPEELVGVSFQMSFAAVAALIAGYELARPAFVRLGGQGNGRRLALHVAGLALTSVLAGVASLPFAAAHFGRIQLYFVLANLVAVPLTALVVMPAGLLALALMPFGLAGIALAPMGAGIGVLLALAHAVAGAPGAVWTIGTLPPSFLPLFALGIAILCLLRTRARLLGVVPMVLAVGLAAAAPRPVLLVGGGGRLLALPWHGTLLVDRGRGVSRLDLAAAGRPWGLVGVPVGLPRDGVSGPARCDDDGCRITLGRAVVLLRRGGAGGGEAPPSCDGIALAVAETGRRPPRCAGVPVLGPAEARRAGATLAFVGADRGVRLVSADPPGTERPWTTAAGATVAERPRAPPSLPMAASE